MIGAQYLEQNKDDYITLIEVVCLTLTFLSSFFCTTKSLISYTNTLKILFNKVYSEKLSMVNARLFFALIQSIMLLFQL